MRIGIDARLVYYSRAGIGQYITGLVKGLSECDEDHEFVLLQSRKDKTVLADQPNFFRKSLWTPSHHRFEQVVLPFEISPLRLDILHSPDFIPPFRRDYKSVITVHDLAFILYPHFLTEESARYYGQIDRAVRHADHIVADSQSTKRDIINFLGVPESKITVIYAAADGEYRPVTDGRSLKTVQEKYSLDGPFLLFVSTIEPRKNLPTLLRAFRRLLDNYKLDVKLTVVGQRGWFCGEVFAVTESLDLSEDIAFLGHVPMEDLVLLYNAAQALVHPSYYEGFGLPPLEAMACGTPSIVANVSSLPEVVGDASLLIPPDDVEGWTVAMWRVLTDDSLHSELSAKGLTRAQLFSWKKAAQATLDLYKRLLA
ncbi:MAG: glycosyltransferase [Anaerolineae bacterium]|nr:glycosyltransferase [Anaerolineae bacterium]NIN93840.1 glycosyltransferase [Anaerolineae bacterium]NIQ76875.1 glycosyltransferase [Anaerolineae bacterium]